MLKKAIKARFPKLYNKYLEFHQIRKHLRYIYYKSLDEKQYPYKLAKIYKKQMKEELDWHNLRTYNEKMQWAKLYDKDQLKTTLSDKYLVRNWIRNKIGDEYLIPLLGVWDTFDDINFEMLPEKFVLKTNNGSGTNIIVIDKNKFNKNEAKRNFNLWLKTNFAFMSGFEMHYKEIKPKIIAEKYIEDKNGDLKDYKFLCFGGNVHYCWIDSERFNDHRRNVYNLEWELQEWNQHKYKNIDFPISKPENFDLMIEIAKKLCEGFLHVRVDLYNVNGKIYFGEMTFTNGCGFERIHPYKYNLMLGELWQLPIDS